MPRGCVIAIIAGSLLILAVSILYFLFVWPDQQRKGTSACIYVIEKAMVEYTADFDAGPEGENGDIAALLLGNNPRDKAYLAKKSIVLRDGQFVDFWKRPLSFTRGTDGSLAVLSSGPNGKFGDDDDIDSQLVRDMIRIAEEKKNNGL